MEFLLAGIAFELAAFLACHKALVQRTVMNIAHACEETDMPIEIQYSDDRKGVDFYAVGYVTGKEIIECGKEIFKEKGFSSLRYWIVDRSRCTEYEVTADEVRLIAELDKRAAKENPNMITAIISETDLQYGMSRMYETFVGESGFKTKLFRDRDTAEKWIERELANIS